MVGGTWIASHGRARVEDGARVELCLLARQPGVPFVEFEEEPAGVQRHVPEGSVDVEGAIEVHDLEPARLVVGYALLGR